MTAFSATPERIIEAILRFPDHIQKQFLIDRMDMYLGHGMIPQQGETPFKIMHMNVPEEAEQLLQFKIEGLKRSKTIHQIFWTINKPDRLQLLQILTGIYVFDKKEYAGLLRDSWISTEFPHQMSIRNLIRMFESADPYFLMTEDEHKALDLMPEKITVYRGYSETYIRNGMTKRRGLSWTIDRSKACWFATRWNTPDAKLLTATVNKSDVYVYTNLRNEEEIVINPYKLKQVQELGVVHNGKKKNSANR